MDESGTSADAVRLVRYFERLAEDDPHYCRPYVEAEHELSIVVDQERRRFSMCTRGHVAHYGVDTERRWAARGEGRVWYLPDEPRAVLPLLEHGLESVRAAALAVSSSPLPLAAIVRSGLRWSSSYWVERALGWVERAVTEEAPWAVDLARDAEARAADVSLPQALRHRARRVHRAIRRSSFARDT